MNTFNVLTFIQVRTDSLVYLTECTKFSSCLKSVKSVI